MGTGAAVVSARKQSWYLILLLLYLLTSALALLVWFGVSIDVDRDTVTIPAGIAAVLTFVFNIGIVRALLEELLLARDEARRLGTPVPAILLGLFIVYFLSLIVLLYRTAYYIARTVGQDALYRAMTEPELQLLVNLLVLSFSAISYYYIARPRWFPRVRAALAWLRRLLGKRERFRPTDDQ